MSSEKEAVTYEEGDIVWVKLGSTWWPCEVRDSGNLPPEVEFKKPPLAVVKFFDEDTYEYIRSWNQICPYNCEKKIEFIKKGMAAFRSNVSHMLKFPRDVTKAEILVGGNPNILSEPMFIPEKKRPHSSDMVQSKSHITHRRFLGVEDYKVFICIQSPEKDRIPGDKDDDEVILLNTEPEKNYNCYDCCFTTKRLEVMVIHKKNHSLNKNYSKTSKKRPAVTKANKEKIKKAKSSSNKDSCENKEKRTSSSKKKKAISSETNKFIDNKVNETPRNPSDIRSDLLAEWDDDDEEMDNGIKSQSTETPEETDTTTMSEVTDMSGVSEVNDTSIVSEANDMSIASEANDTSILSEANDTSIVSEANDTSIVSEANDTSIVSEANDKSIVSEANDTSIVSQTNHSSILSEGNYTSIVSETNDTSSISETNDTDIVSETNYTSIVSKANETSIVSEATNTSITEETSEKTSECPANFGDDSVCIEKEESSISINATVKSHNISEDSSNVDKSKKMDQATEQAIKSCFDFDEEDEEEGSVIISTTVTGRKIPRVIPLTDKRKSTDVSIENSITSEEEIRDKYELDTAFNELMETTNMPELPDLQRTLKCEQNFHKSKAIKFPDKDLEKSSNSTKTIPSEKVDIIEVATKLTNPKKRFVKSFEDFELKQSVSKKKEEQSQNKNNKESIVGEIGKTTEKNVEINTASTDFLKLNTSIVPKNTQYGVDQELQVMVNENEKDDIKLIQSVQIAIDDKPNSSPFITDQPEKMKEDEKDDIELIQSVQIANDDKPSSSPFITDQPEKMKEDEKDDIKLIQSVQIANDDKPSSSPFITDQPEKMEEDEKYDIKLIQSVQIANDDKPSSSPDITDQPEKKKEDEKDDIKLIDKANADEPSGSPDITDQPEKMIEDAKYDIKAMGTRQMTKPDEPNILPSITDQSEKIKEDEKDYINLMVSGQMANADEPISSHEITDQAEEIKEYEKDDIKIIDSRKNTNTDKSSSSHKQTPRSKILETYFSRSTKEKLESTTVSKETICNPSSSEIKHNIPPKKKLHARIGHPKKDKTLFSFFLNKEIGKNGTESTDQMDFTETKLQSPGKNKTNESPEMNKSEINDAKYLVQYRTNIANKTNLENEIIPTTISKPIESLLEPNYLLDQQITSTKNSEKSTNFHLELSEEISGRVQEGIRDVKEIISCSSSDHTVATPQIPTNLESEIMEKQDTSNKANGNNSNHNIPEVKKDLMTQTMETSCSLETLFVTEREEHPELEKATTCLPDDAICSPPRKRNHSELEILEPLDQSEPINKKQKRKDELDISNKNVIIHPEDNFTSDSGILMEVSQCVDELITKVSESQLDNSENQKIACEMIIETKLNDISSDKTTTNDNFCETEMSENAQIVNTVETLTNMDQERSKMYEIDNEDLSVPCSLSEDFPNETFEQCHVSDYANEEIVEEVIYCTEQDALVEELIETHEESLTDIECMSTDINDGANCSESVNIVDTKDDNIQNSNNESLNETTVFNLVTEKSKEVSDITKLCENIQLTKEKDCAAKNSLCKATEHEKPFPENTVEDDAPQKEIPLQSNMSNFSDAQVSLGAEVEADSQLTTVCDNIPNIKEISPQHSIQERDFSDHLRNVEGNLTVVTEMELAEGQVEITPEQIISSSKIINPSHFCPDLSDSTNDSSSATDLSEPSKGLDSKATTNEKKGSVSKEIGVAFGRTELLNILEGDTDSDKKKIKVKTKKSFIEDFCDFEDHIPSQIVCATRLKPEKDDTVPDRKDKGFKTKKNYKIASTTSKLLERLTETKKDVKNVKIDVTESVSETPPVKANKGKPSSSKPIILSEQIIKTASEKQKSTFKEALNDIEDLETFIIHKDSKKPNSEKDLTKPSVEKKSAKVGKNTGKAKILQQTIITASGEIIQPAVTLAQSDENIFDINSMPIVLSDSILTPENIEKMTVLSTSQSTTSPKITPTSTVVMAGKRSVDNKTITKPPSTLTVSVAQPSTSSLNVTTKSTRTPRILQSSSNRIIHRGTSSNSSKPGKFILVPQAATLPNTKGVVKKMVLKRSPVVQSKQPCNTSEVSGNKIMILTNQQGQQQRLLLTPAQQKILGCQPQIPKVSKTIIKGNIQSNTVIPKTVISPTETKSGPESNLASSAEQSVLLVNSPIAADKKILSQTSNVPQVIKTARPLQTNYKSSQNAGKVQQTLMLKKQTVKRVKETNEDLEKQVAEQLEAIKASSGVKIESRVKSQETMKTMSKHITNQNLVKRNEPRYKIMSTSVKVSKSEEVKSPILTSINSKQSSLKEQIKSKELKVSPERPLNQLVVQDALGNQTTIVEGQILALPSETINGQPQSYILVTLDQTGTLTPLNNEALMSLDPNLELGGDIGNTVLQIEQGTLTSAGTSRPLASSESVIMKSSKGVGNITQNNLQEQLDIRNATKQSSVSANDQLLIKPKVTDVLLSNQNVEQTVASNANTGPGQQLIISGDPLATQKFLESLTEGTTDLANLLANADTNGILIHTDGQQILINTESNNQVLLSVNNENVGITENNESTGNPIFATQLNKSQDILAAALADTDVFQQDQNLSQNKFSSQLSPNNPLYPINVGNVLETSLTLSSPIMTPLEVPSTNNKKITDEAADILKHVPKNVDLPITITDPNISQTVANQQVASFITTELQSNLELNLPISETAMSSVSKDLHSPSFSYAFSTLEDSEDITQKTFNSSMPLLSEDAEETADMTKTESETHHKRYQNSSFRKYKVLKDTLDMNKRGSVERTSFLEEDDEEEKGRFTLGRQMCSSLSEPPPEMFDLVNVNSSFVKNRLTTSLQSTPDSVERAKDDELTDISIHAENSSDGSCEIPVQPKIIAKSQNLDLLNSD